MAKTDRLLNKDALARPNYYAGRAGNPLEDDVKSALDESAKGTPFAGTIEKVSGQRFPDIVAAKLYGVEVKSTKDNHWTSTGSSILETTRVSGVDRIYMTFGKLGGRPIEFLSKPYEECLYGIAVTHMPRYLINMQLRSGETIFDKMGVPYDELRQMDNPIAPVAKYYKSLLGPGESLWWTGNSDEDAAAPPTVKLWSALSPEGKERLTVQGYALFPEVLMSGSPKKYNRYALWLVTEKGVVNTNIRDSFSAGGKVDMKTSGGVAVKMPAAFGRIKKYHELIEDLLFDIDEAVLSEYWNEDIEENRLRQWCRLVAQTAETYPDVGYRMAWGVLSGIFPNINRYDYSDTLRSHNRFSYDLPERQYGMVAETTVPYGDRKIKLDSTRSLNLSVTVGDEVENTANHKRGVVKGFLKDLIIVDFGGVDEPYQFPDCFTRRGFLQKV